ncbi:hypothetical protein ACFELO_00660 [Oceanicaulis sp. LC35]|uniref:hypothetical protein n=1 Tax=Oceanicaulis sp. LC35 TaxID=3349635 RepID=UPI003F87F8EC
MLYTYQGAAIPENWVHEWLVDMLTELLDAIDAGNEPAEWKDCVPVGRPNLVRRLSIRDTRADLIRPLSEISEAERSTLRDAIVAQNNIPAVLNGMTACPLVSEFPEAVRKPFIEYFKAGFNLIGSLDVRQSHYQAIFDSMPVPVCPFCGTEIMTIPRILSEDENAPNQDLDHYIPISLYPLAGSNLHNLVPMGSTCNSRFKKAQDIIRKADGRLRPAFDPFGPVASEISLAGSRFPAAVDAAAPDWQITLSGGDQANTWDAVWDIKRRLREDVISPKANRWLENAAKVSNRLGVRPRNKAELIQWLERSLEAAQDDQHEVYGAAKVAFWEFLLEQLNTDGPEQDFELFLLGLFDSALAH